MAEPFFTDLDCWWLQIARSIYEDRTFLSANKSDQDVLNFIKMCAGQIVNRIVIIRLAEDKGIIKAKQLLDLKEKWQKNKERSTAIQLLNEFSHKMHHILPTNLFLSNHSCERVNLNNELLCQIILNSYEHNFSNFTSDVLGRMYERFLGYDLVLSNETVTFVAAQDLQKAMGVYYTPQYIISFILRNTLALKLEQIQKRCLALLEDRKIERAKQQVSEIQRIKVLDPACGAGAFLLSAFALIESYYHRLFNLLKTQLNEHLTLSIVPDNLFGVDLDESASEITIVSLLLQSLDNNQHYDSEPPINIKYGNAIHPFDWDHEFAEILSGQKFTFVIGNPPYIAWSKIPNRTFLEDGKFLDLEYDCRPNHEDAQPNIYLFFLVRAINLIKEGRIGFILPQEWRFENYAQKFRNYLLEKANAIEIIRFNPNFKVFHSTSGVIDRSVGTNALILFIDIIERPDRLRILTEYYIDKIDENQVISILANFETYRKISPKVTKRFADIADLPWLFAHPHEEMFKARIESLPNVIPLKNLDYFKVKGGFQPPINQIRYFQLSTSDLHSLTQEELNYVFHAIHDASEIQRYFLARRDQYWIVLNDIPDENELKTSYPNLYEILVKRIKKKSPDWWKFPNIRNFELIKSSPIKLLSPRTASQNSFCIDTEKSVFKGTNTLIISTQLDPYYVIGILNSRLADFWYSKFGFEYHGERTKKYEPQKIRMYSLPIVKPSDEAIENALVSLVKKYISLRKEMPENSAIRTDELQKLDHQINKIVYTLYNLTEDEIKLVEINER